MTVPAMPSHVDLDTRDFGVVGDCNGTTGTDDTAAFQAAINALQPGQTLHHNVWSKISGSMTITNKRHIRITGKGTLQFIGTKTAANMFQVVGTVDDLEIDGLTIIGEKNQANKDQVNMYQTAIGNDSGQIISNTRFHDLTIKNVNVGISHNADYTDPVPTGIGTKNSWTNGWCYNNYMENILGVNPGQGYGIHMVRAQNMRVYNNIIVNAERHSIYCGKGYGLNTIIESNSIVNHRANVAVGDPRCGIQVTRSNGVSVLNNKFLNCFDGQIYIGQDSSAPGYDCSGVTVQGNTFQDKGNSSPSIWIGEQATPNSIPDFRGQKGVFGPDAVANVLITGNTFISSTGGDDIYILNGSKVCIEGNTFRRYKASLGTGQIIEIGAPAWISKDKHLEEIVIKNNTASSDVSVSGSRFCYISAPLCGGATPYVIKDNVLRNINMEWYNAAPMTNPNSKLKFCTTIKLAIASMPANSYASYAYAVPGVKPTSLITGRPQDSVNSPLAHQAFPSDVTPGQVRVWLQNPTGSAVTNWSNVSYVLNIEDI